MTTYKICSLCKDSKLLLKEFNKKSSSKDGFQNVCRDCNSKRNKIHYKDNTSKVKERNSNRNKSVRNILRQYVVEYLLNHPCVDCPESDIRCLEFDHIKDKSCNVANILTRAGTLSDLTIEIAKCEVRCANCHRKKTAINFNWYKIYMNV